ncbi:MAG: F0F1 ATP synthase subunit B [Microscillaceae bacterium]|nr:F0F1 ATP synthase subunit B [Microscillaceae bacterium]MDW8460978.1 F0F1 ATP synthase subunit B [Cytophagales bacterium]
MDLIKPEFGLIFWQTVTFLVVVFVLSRVAWKPIINGLKEREKSIAEALEKAEQARKEVALSQANNEKLLEEARIERDKIIRLAQKAADDFRNEACNKASAEAAKIIEEAKKAIETEKQQALAQIKTQIATLSIEIAEKLLKQQLENPEKQKQLVENLIKNLELN